MTGDQNKTSAVDAKGARKGPGLRALFSPSSIISGLLFVALVALSLYCFDWKRDSMLDLALSAPLEFDVKGKSNLVKKAEQTMSRGYFYSAERLYTKAIVVLEKELLGAPSTEDAVKLWTNLAFCRNGLAEIKLEGRRYPEAKVINLQAIELCHRHDLVKSTLGKLLITEAEIEHGLGNEAESVKILTEAKAAYAKAEDNAGYESAKKGFDRFLLVAPKTTDPAKSPAH